jgi:hypothetical protein
VQKVEVLAVTLVDLAVDLTFAREDEAAGVAERAAKE